MTVLTKHKNLPLHLGEKMTPNTLEDKYQAAIQRGKKMKDQNPLAIIFVVYDKELQKYEVWTDEQLQKIYYSQQVEIKGWKKVIKCEL